ncbi:helix-turn-helix domain-containing protein [Burkholderia stagnalis]|uniref:helix-turn-helix domain-containing protein n=1 Tax=Burkholderia stagnalis TaxID=1503054 RepID=UPI00075F3625|nr:AraC family transcriptional regulator [Burkholderia stagnalis]KVN00654.1 AraC family transcriptional regulator [Burkholderia stagnalis]KVN50616.1 AraC family transcriptional regulator [Burkholderia stagnalis]KWD99124.1 AraC family transcriptional regulator [Burkholderia stagnalis]KWE12938.1 AraC family transcriptional regulator [Burkholderia stagnalis]KWO80841.1 AraC family transcriptional regulator [Burkholderia stagnalis]
MSDATLAAHPAAGVPVILRSSAERGWQGFGAALLGIRAGTYRVPAADDHRVGVHVGAPVRANCACDGSRQARIQAQGDADVIPAGLPGRWTDDGDCRILRISISDAFARATFDQLELKPSQAQIRCRMQVRDPRLQHIAWALSAELEADDASDPLYAESLCTALVARLADAAPSFRGRRHALAPKAAARVIDYIEDHLDQRLTLSELAALAAISVPHFKVLFRETLGMPVHRYVVQRRVERAKALLLEGRLSVGQVALEAGFAHQSHLASWMNRLLGVTPREIARSGAQHADA